MRFLNAIGFLTIIKISPRFYLKKEDYPKVLVYFPVVGLILGLTASILFVCLNFIFPLFLTIIFIVCMEVILTGGIHIDGLADTFDGIFSGEKDKNKIHQIMKKGDVGVFGVLAIIFSVALKAALLYFIAKELFIRRFFIYDPSLKSAAIVFKETLPGLLVFVFILVFIPVYGRLSILFLFSRSNTTKREGSLSSAFIDKINNEIFILSSIYLSIIFVVAGIFFHLGFLNFSMQGIPFAESASIIPGEINGLNYSMLLSTILLTKFNIGIEMIAVIAALKLVIVVILTFLFIAAISRFFTRRIDTVSGDIFGAVCVLTEIFFLLLNYIVIKFV
jgi:adenosylcobinamide-GDP ribazoletransferase